MLQHIVMFQLQEEAQGAKKEDNLARASRYLDGFKGRIPTLKDFHYQCNLEGTPEDNYDLALFCTFEDVAGMEEYKVHPIHKEFSQYITSVRKERACIDYLD